MIKDKIYKIAHRIYVSLRYGGGNNDPMKCPVNNDPMKCPVCGNDEFYEGSILPSTFYVCTNCGALVQETPIGGLRLILKDARDRFLECSNWDVKKWKK